MPMPLSVTAVAAKQTYDAIVDDLDPDGTFSLFAQPPTINMPGKGAKGADPLSPEDERYMAEKFAGVPAKKPTVDRLGERFEDPRLGESSVEPDPEDDPESAFAPLVDDALSESAPAPAPDIIPDGDWKYKALGDGRFEIVGTPPGSRARGMVLDPAKIAMMPEGSSKARLMRAYDSIKSVAQGGDPLPRLSAPKKSAPAAAPAATPALPPSFAQDVEGIEGIPRNPAFGDGREAVVESSPTPSKEPYGRARGFLRRFKDTPVEGGGAF